LGVGRAAVRSVGPPCGDPGGVFLTRTTPTGRRSVLQVLDHLPARLGAVPAGFSAVGHVLVVLVLLALGGALVAALRAAVARLGGERAHPRGQGRGQLTAFGTIDADLGG